MGASTVVDSMRERVQARLRELEPLVAELDDLERAREALLQVAPRSVPVHHVSPRSRRRGQGRRPRYAGGSKRRPRGANRAAIQKALTEHGPQTAPALQGLTGIGRGVLAATLSQMKAIGLVDNDGGLWGAHAGGHAGGADVRGSIAMVAGNCPMGCGSTLFVGEGGHVTCSLLGCPRPTAVDELLSDRETEHVVVFADSSYVIQHPLRERIGGDLFDCPLHAHLQRCSGAPVTPGRYRAEQRRGGSWVYTLIGGHDGD